MRFPFFRKIAVLFLLINLWYSKSFAQQDSIIEINLQEVIIKAFEQNQKLKNVPAAVNYIGRRALDRFNPASIVAAINSTPGVRMEERSPGSYRINIRGSSLRAPFGVRNVKVYYNDLPITDPGGTTYLNALGFYNFNTIEIIKGPGSSLYGAGTGGTMLIESLSPSEENGIKADYSLGTGKLNNNYVAVTSGNENFKSRISYQHQTSDGYRKQSSLQRNVVSWNANFNPSPKQLLKFTFLYSDLYYQTPGALTFLEYGKDPTAARPSSGAFPGAEQSGAAIYQKTFLAGASFKQKLGDKFSNTTGLYGMYTDFRNPAIRNYGRNTEPHFGGRSVFTFRKPLSHGFISMNIGGEWQQNLSSFGIYKNVNGQPDSMRTLDEASNKQAFIFGQVNFQFKNWTLTAGTSINQNKLRFKRMYPIPIPLQYRKFNNEAAPRLALLKSINKFTFYTSVAKGFSPPATAELLPTGSAINLDLKPENEISYDVGVRGDLSDFYLDVNVFTFSLTNTIVQRRDAGGGEFFLNAGKTKQSGVETYLNFNFLKSSSTFKQSLLWLSHTYNHFQYKEFKQLTLDFGGKKIPGTAPQTLAAGLDIAGSSLFFAAITYYYSDKIPLSDANTIYAKNYHLLGSKVGYQKVVHQRVGLKLFAGVENILNQKYSLGNDLNAFGGRYFNAAPLRNYYAGLSVQLKTKKVK